MRPNGSIDIPITVTVGEHGSINTVAHIAIDITSSDRGRHNVVSVTNDAFIDGAIEALLGVCDVLNDQRDSLAQRHRH